ncbi:MAG: alkaline phosphatase family protein [Methylococcales bacterium]|nr:alkaline phosphatase family protein [Methylococcales bacterium]
MQKVFNAGEQLPVRRSVLTLAIAAAMLAPCAANATVSIHGVVAGSHFTAPVNSDNPSLATASSTAASVYQNAKVCFDHNSNGACDSGETSTVSKADGSFLITSMTAAPLVAEISTSSTNNGNAVAERTVFRVAQDQITASTIAPMIPVNIAVTPLSTEVLRSMENDGVTFAAAKTALASRLGVDSAVVLNNPATVTNSTQRTAMLTESNILTNRWTLAAKMVDRGDVSTAALAANSSATGPAIQIPEAQNTAVNLEGIPRYDHIFIIMLENKGTNSIKGSAYAPKINALMTAGNQFTSYFATGNPSEPNYTALGSADDWGITDDNQWNCGATGANAIQDLVIPTNAALGLASSPFTNPCSQATNHNIIGRANLFNAMTSNGMNWRTYNESMNPGQDFRTDSVADSSIYAVDYNNVNIHLPLPAQLYRTKHHPGMAFQNVRSAPEFATSNRTMGGGQWDAVLPNSNKYTVPGGYDIDQFGTDLASGDIGNLNFLIPDQCDDMHSITVNGTNISTSQAATATDCSGTAIITRGDNYVSSVVNKIQASSIWTNPNKRSAIVIMFDEGTATSGYNGCCGWNPGNSTVAKPLIENADGTYSVDTTVTNYTQGNRGHGESIFVVLTNQTAAPKGIVDSDYYSHFSFVRTVQDMFGLADPGVEGSYMNRSKYTESFIAANILNLPEYVGSADTHFDSVRPMNHAYVIPAGYTEKQSSDISTPAQTGPDATQANLWAVK